MNHPANLVVKESLNGKAIRIHGALHSPVPIGSIDYTPHFLESLQHVAVGESKEVVGSGGDDADLGAHRAQKRTGAGCAASMVRAEQDIALEGVSGTGNDLRLAGPLQVPRKEEGCIDVSDLED